MGKKKTRKETKYIQSINRNIVVRYNSNINYSLIYIKFSNYKKGIQKEIYSCRDPKMDASTYICKASTCISLENVF